jgi:hypothetical protein
MASELEVGKIGVGAAPSTYQLDVTTTGNNGIRTGNGTDQVYMGSTGGAAAIGTLSNTALNVITNGVSRLTISDAGLATFSAGIQVNGAVGSFASGIYFSGQTGTAATGATTTTSVLNHYEVGTWTPSLTGTTATIDPAYATGTYTRIGNLVYVGWYSGSLTLASSSGSASIAGLPFPVTNSYNGYTPFSYQHGNAVDGASRGGYFSKNTSQMDFVDTGGLAGASYVDGSGLHIMMSGVYTVD